MLDVVLLHDDFELILDCRRAHLGLSAPQDVSDVVRLALVLLVEEAEVLEFTVVVQVACYWLKDRLQFFQIFIQVLLFFCKEAVDYFPLVLWHSGIPF